MKSIQLRLSCLFFILNIYCLYGQQPGTVIEQGTANTFDANNFEASGGYLKIGKFDDFSSHLSIDSIGIQSVLTEGGNFPFNLLLNPYGGNVGIGKQFPITKLDIQSNSNSWFSGIGLSDSDGDRYHMYKDLTDKFNIGFNGTNQVTLDNDKLGIGTESPQHTLDVNGNINTNGKLLANGVAGTNGQVLTTNMSGNISWTTLLTGDTDWMESGNNIYKLNGNVGIGTSNPLHSLDVNGDINTNARLLADGIAGTDGQVLTTDANGIINWEDSAGPTSDTDWTESGDNVFRLNGKVGIGINIPLSPLHIRANFDNLRLDGTASSMSFYDENDYKAYIQSIGSTMSIINRKNGNFLIGTNNQVKLAINGNGNVGIGTSVSNVQSKVKIKTASPTSSGLLIENSSGGAHNWIPYSDGGVYLTADNSNNQFARFTFRGYNTNGYSDWVTMAVDEATFNNRIRTPWLVVDHYNQQGGLIISGTNNSSGWRLSQDPGFSGDEDSALKFWFGGTLPRQLQSDGDWVLFSDKRLKTNIKSLSNGQLTKLLNIEPSKYNYINQPKANVKFGFIAQNVIKEFPELVSETVNGKLGVNYEGFIPLLTAAIQEQQQIINSQKSKITEIESELNSLKEELAIIKEMLEKE